MPIQIQAPDGSIAEFPDGTPDAVIERVMRQEYGVSNGSNGGESGGEAAGNSNYWSMREQALDTVTMGGATKGSAAVGGLVDSVFDAVHGKGWDYSKNYENNLARLRANQEAYNEENPVRSGVGTAAGVTLGVTSMPVWGRGLLGAAGTGAVYGTAGGALQDADSLGERATNSLLGTVTGAGIGSAGYGLAKGALLGIRKGGDVLSVMRAPPEIKALSQIQKTADDVAGPYNAMSLSRQLNDLGPDAINADVLGKRGIALGRGASNISPEAREITEGTLNARKANQNIRLATDVETASGLPVGNTKNVDALKDEAFAKVRPQINAAYDAARKAGAEIPFEAFDNIITTPVGQKAFKQALDNVTSRAARDPSAGGNLAVLDETKRLLDGYATQAFRAGDPMGSEYAATAKALREQVDAFLASGDEYALARSLRQSAYKASDAFDLGQELGGARVGLGVPQKASGIDPALAPNVAKGYGATKVEGLLNRGSTEGAYNDLMTPQGKQATAAALGPKAKIVEKGLAREKAFNITNRELLGNSTTARQLAEMAGTGVGTAGVGMLLGFDPATSGTAGLLMAAGRKAIPTITKRLVTENQKAVAPYLAKLLTAHGFPTSQPLPVPQLANFFEKVATAGDAKMAKTLALIWNQQVQNTKPQMNPAK